MPELNIDNLQPQFMVGDTVEIIKNTDQSPSGKHFNKYIGKRFTISLIKDEHTIYGFKDETGRIVLLEAAELALINESNQQRTKNKK